MAGQADGSIIVDTEIDAAGFRAGSTELQRAIKSLNTKVENLGPTLQKVVSGGRGALSAFDAKAAALENTISELKAKLASLGEQRVPTDDYQWLATEIGKAKNELAKLEEKQSKMQDLGVKESSKSWQSLQYDIDLAKQKIADYEADQKDMRNSGMAFQMGSNTVEYARLESALASARNRLAEMQTQAMKVHGSVRGFIAALRNAPPLSERLKNALSGVLSVVSRIGSGFRSVGSAILNSVTHPLRTLDQSVGSVISGLGYIGKKGVQGFGKLVSGIKAGISKLNEFRKSSGGCGSAMKNLGKKITGVTSMLKRMVLRKLMMAMITAVKDGFNNLSQYSAQTNADLSKLKSGLTQLKNSFAAAFAPILTTVTPILVTLINYLSSALTYIGKLFAALTGAKTFTKATAVQENYAASLGNTGKAAEEAKRQLAGFDDLNVLSGSSSKDSSGNEGSASPSEMFEEVPIESGITDFVAKIKETFKNGDYAGIGKMIGTKINEAVQKANDFIKWDNVGGAITEFVSGVAEGFNSLNHAVNWTHIGDTLAQGFNTALNTLFLIITKFDWPRLAAGFAQGLNGLVTGIDWALLGTTLSAGVRTLLATLRTAITTFDWASLGRGVADSVNNIDWVGILSDVAGGVSDILSGALDLLIGFAETLDWGKLGSDLWNGLVGIVTNIDWGGIISKAFRLLGDALGGCAELIAEFCKSLWADLKQGFLDTVSYFDEYIKEAGGNIIEGLWNGITDALKNVGNWIVCNIWNPFIEGFKNAFGIHSPSTKMAEQGRYIIDGLWQGLKDAWHNITSFFSEKLEGIKTTISNAWQNIKTTASQKWKSIKTTLSDAWDGLKTTASQKWNKLKSTISTAWDEVKTTANQKWNGIKTVLSGAWDSIKKTASQKIDSLKTTVQNGWNNIKEKATTWGKDICSNLAGGIEKAKNTVGNAVEGVADKIKSFLGFSEPEDGPLSNFHTYMPDMLELMASGIKQNQGKAISAVSGVASAISSEIQNGDYSLKNANIGAGIDGTMNSFSDKIVGGFDRLIDRLRAIAGGVTFAARSWRQAALFLTVFQRASQAPAREISAGSSKAPMMNSPPLLRRW